MKLTVKAILHDSVVKDFVKDGKKFQYYIGVFSLINSAGDTDELLLCKVSKYVYQEADYGVVGSFVYDTDGRRITDYLGKEVLK